MKPNLSAGARGTGRFGPAAHASALALVERIRASGRVALVQQYVRLGRGARRERARVLGGELSHTLRKRAILRADEVAPTSAASSAWRERCSIRELISASAAARESCASRAA